jgi:hypothetical protein
MSFNPTPFNVTTGLLAAFACWVVLIRTKGQSYSNIPLFYYGVVVYYVVVYGEWTTLPPLLVYVTLIFALLLRFEFMNSAVAKAVSLIECCGLAAIIYFNLSTMFGWT